MGAGEVRHETENSRDSVSETRWKVRTNTRSCLLTSTLLWYTRTHTNVHAHIHHAHQDTHTSYTGRKC